MKRILIIFAVFCIFFSFPLVAQEAQESSEEEYTEEFVYEVNQQGDQYISMKLNVSIPYKPFGNLFVGGSGSLGYHHFILDDLTIGGNVSFKYNSTIGSNVFYVVPLMFTASYQFDIGQWEVPVSLEIGGAFQNYIDRMYFGLAIRPEIAGYYRFSRDWSFGLHTGVYILPQWYSNPEYNYTGIIQDIGLSVRYHF